MTSQNLNLWNYGIDREIFAKTRMKAVFFKFLLYFFLQAALLTI